MRNNCYCGNVGCIVVDHKWVCLSCFDRMRTTATNFVKSEPRDIVPVLLYIVREILEEQNKTNN